MSAQYNNQMYPTNNTQFNNNNQQQNQMFNQTYCRPNEFLAVDVINGGEVEANAYCVAPGITTFLIDFQNNLMINSGDLSWILWLSFNLFNVSVIIV